MSDSVYMSKPWDSLKFLTWAMSRLKNKTGEGVIYTAVNAVHSFLGDDLYAQACNDELLALSDAERDVLKHSNDLGKFSATEQYDVHKHPEIYLALSVVFFEESGGDFLDFDGLSMLGDPVIVKKICDRFSSMTAERIDAALVLVSVLSERELSAESYDEAFTLGIGDPVFH